MQGEEKKENNQVEVCHIVIMKSRQLEKRIDILKLEIKRFIESCGKVI